MTKRALFDSLCRVSPRLRHVLLCLGLAFAAPPSVSAESPVQGSLTANGAPVELPYVYVWREKEGFYDAADPTWNILFVGRELEPRELGEPVWDAAWVHVGVTETDEFTDAPELRVYLQSVKLSADAAGNMSGGEYPRIELEGLGSDIVSGRIWHEALQESFDDTYQYDFVFQASMSDPDAPIGDLLPAGGGEPGRAYLKWVETIHGGDVEALKLIVPADMAEQLGTVTPEEAREEIGFMQAVTPTDVTIVSGSSDGETALLQVEGVMEGERVSAEVTMTRMGDHWIPTGFSM